MTRKKQPAPTQAQGFPRKSVPVKPGASERETAQNVADVLTSPELAAYRVINGAELKSGMGEHIDVPSLMAKLRDQAASVNSGCLAQAEAMLMNQATALQSLFARLAERAMGHTTIPGFDANMRMALRAQSQCRCTLETLATIKNPPIVYARQANVTTGPQQINNGMAARPRARQIVSEQNELLEAPNDERMDTRPAGPAGTSDQAMEAMGAVNGTDDPRR
ncbi:MAG: hypothetical protein BroJett026_34690 [Betaproteobacteria bacterium]|nr:MAG: hypothetical protein BroJett026_34690 [Betaproteobacteria bacterium]